MEDSDQTDNNYNNPESTVDVVVLLSICLLHAIGARGKGGTQAQLMTMMTGGGGGGWGGEKEGGGGGGGWHMPVVGAQWYCDGQ